MAEFNIWGDINIAFINDGGIRWAQLSKTKNSFYFQSNSGCRWNHRRRPDCGGALWEHHRPSDNVRTQVTTLPKSSWFSASGESWRSLLESCVPTPPVSLPPSSSSRDWGWNTTSGQTQHFRGSLPFSPAALQTSPSGASLNQTPSTLWPCQASSPRGEVAQWTFQLGSRPERREKMTSRLSSTLL